MGHPLFQRRHRRRHNLRRLGHHRNNGMRHHHSHLQLRLCGQCRRSDGYIRRYAAWYQLTLRHEQQLHACVHVTALLLCAGIPISTTHAAAASIAGAGACEPCVCVEFDGVGALVRVFWLMCCCFSFELVCCCFDDFMAGFADKAPVRLKV